MSFVERRRPQFSEAEALEIARSLYRTHGVLKELPSERDQNFYLRDSSGKEFVLKIASTLEPEETLEMQNKAMERVASRTGTALAPRICRNVQNKAMTAVLDSHGLPHLVRMLTFLPGIPLALFKPHSPQLLQNLGKALARIDQALEGFNHTAAKRDLRWDFDRAEWVLTHFGDHVASNHHGALLYFKKLWRDRVIPYLPSLRKSVVYHDANEYNVLVLQKDFESEPTVGFIDFGDMLFTYTIAELAIGAAYAMLDKADPLSAAAEVVRGYHAAFPLTEQEMALLYYFIGMRLCLSVSICAFQQYEEPENEYLKISERPAWNLLVQWKAIHPRRAEYVFRHACGLPPHPKTFEILQWFEDHKHQAVRPTREDYIGEYGEIREVGPYSGVPGGMESFRFQGNDGFDWRTVHLGLDYFADPGTSIYSPLDGVIHSFQNNVGAGDYGPTIVLQVPAQSHDFFLLFGHLSSDSLLGLYPGKTVAKGACIGRIGTSEENGNWKPHLHLQVILDLLDQTGTFPGLCPSSQKAIWFSLCPDPNRIFGEKSQALKTDSPSHLLARRSEHISKSLSVSYRKPLLIVKGRGQYLFDENGFPYLDCVNNVCHVGHSHPRVLEAANKQMKELNTNTRYLHPNLLAYAERLCAKLPDPLRVCFFVCSGSEANDLALRLARAYTGSINTVVLDSAYHGNLVSLIEVSPYKFEGPGGHGAPPYVRKVLMPDTFRGPYTGEDAGAKYAEDVATKISSFTDSGRVTFITESALGCGGQIILPPGYLENAFRHVRNAGGVCIADEVQVGFGRAGTNFWFFETQNVIPDIVTMGKPIGNGHPMAAVVTTPRIAAAFENGMEYFNTFGGNPVSCAIGLAVLDVIEEERLQEHAQEIGQYMKLGLDSLKQRHSLIGDVRGLGLFLGLEIVKDRKTLTPLPQQASYIVERMRDRGFLLSTDGPYHNVIKIKPPLAFTRENADSLIENLDVVLSDTVLSL